MAGETVAVFLFRIFFFLLYFPLSLPPCVPFTPISTNDLYSCNYSLYKGCKWKMQKNIRAYVCSRSCAYMCIYLISVLYLIQYICIHIYTRVCTSLFYVYFVCFLIAKICNAFCTTTPVKILASSCGRATASVHFLEFRDDALLKIRRKRRK